MARRDGRAAARDFLFQPGDALSSSCAERVEISSPSTISGSFLRGCRSSRSMASLCLSQRFRVSLCPAQMAAQAMKAIAVENPGPDYRLVLDDSPRPEPGPGEVLIKVAAAGLNNADLLQARGHYPPPPGASPILGMEVSGIIAELGEGVRDWKVGDKVCALLARRRLCRICGGRCRLRAAGAGQRGPGRSGGLARSAFTVWTNIIDARPAAAGRDAADPWRHQRHRQPAIQMFAARGHHVFTTAGSEEKCEAARGFGAARAINYRSEDFVAVVKDETGGKGVDVILDMVGGDYIQRNIEAAAPWGRIVNIAYQEGFKAEVNFAPVLTKRLTLAATTLRGRDAGAETGHPRRPAARGLAAAGDAGSGR